MSNISKTVSCKSIIAKVARTFKPPSSEWIRDCVEDIGWGIQAIGYHTAFVNKVTEFPYIEVKNNRAKIPCDVERIIHVEHLVGAGHDNNYINADGSDRETQENTCIKYHGVRLKLGSDTSMYGNRTTHISSSTSYYNVNGDYIITQFESGLIRLHYIAFAVDEEGMPLVIDDYDYKSCLEWYVVSQMMLRGFKHPSVSYQEAFAKFEMYKYRAENAVKMISLDSAERLATTWCRYVQSMDFSQNFYMGLESQEHIAR